MPRRNRLAAFVALALLAGCGGAETDTDHDGASLTTDGGAAECTPDTSETCPDQCTVIAQTTLDDGGVEQMTACATRTFISTTSAGLLCFGSRRLSLRWRFFSLLRGRSASRILVATCGVQCFRSLFFLVCRAAHTGRIQRTGIRVCARIGIATMLLACRRLFRREVTRHTDFRCLLCAFRRRAILRRGLRRCRLRFAARYRRCDGAAHQSPSPAGTCLPSLRHSATTPASTSA